MPARPMLLHRPSFLFDCFVKLLATCKNCLGKWFTAPHGKKYISRTPMIDRVRLNTTQRLIEEQENGKVSFLRFLE